MRKELKLIGVDNWSRPVYECEGRLFCDIDPSSVQPDLHSKANNQFDGEPDSPAFEDDEVIFIPHRITWFDREEFNKWE